MASQICDNDIDITCDFWDLISELDKGVGDARESAAFHNICLAIDMCDASNNTSNLDIKCAEEEEEHFANPAEESVTESAHVARTSARTMKRRRMRACVPGAGAISVEEPDDIFSGYASALRAAGLVSLSEKVTRAEDKIRSFLAVEDALDSELLHAVKKLRTTGSRGDVAQ